jgi:prevent-host-death family protein
MSLYFAQLSMTELRNAPGEILDRVADEGEAFIIERNGKQKACLVPLSIFSPDIPPSRIAEEFQRLNDQGEKPRTSFTEGREIAFSFPADKDNDSSIRIAILLPHGYPNNCPRVTATPVRDDSPHRWADGALCIYGVMTGWNPGKHTVLSTLQLARRWVENYEIWSSTGEWPAIGGNAE